MNNIAPDIGFDLIDVEHPDSLFKIRTAIRSGFHVLVYIDGNAGAGIVDSSIRTATTINFMEGKLKIRTGVAFLSFLMQCPILPVITDRKPDGSNGMEIGSEIRIVGAVSKPLTN